MGARFFLSVTKQSRVQDVPHLGLQPDAMGSRETLLSLTASLTTNPTCNSARPFEGRAFSCRPDVGNPLNRSAEFPFELPGCTCTGAGLDARMVLKYTVRVQSASESVSFADAGHAIESEDGHRPPDSDGTRQCQVCGFHALWNPEPPDFRKG